MSQLTEKQAAFVANKAAGMSNVDAATAAGYSEKCAGTSAGKLMMRKDIVAMIEDARGDLGKTGEECGMRDNYASSLAFLQHAYNNPKLSKSMRMQAAAAALPYEHAKMGEQGKKEKAKDRARAAVQRPRFAPKEAPHLKLVE